MADQPQQQPPPHPPQIVSLHTADMALSHIAANTKDPTALELLVSGTCHPKAPTFMTLTFDDDRQPICIAKCAVCAAPVAEIVLGYEQ